MEIPAEYNLAGQPWEKKEDEQLIKEYTIDELNVLDLCKIHKRMPGGIISRLKHLNLIVMRNQARGHLQYQQSDLYKEICKYKEENRIKRNTERNKQPLITNAIYKPIADKQTVIQQNKQLSSDIMQLKMDVKEMNEKINKILDLMNAVYEFENQS